MLKIGRTRLLGPHDRRLRRNRCAGCAHQHLKCEGGIPCRRCEKAGEACSLSQLAPSRSHKVFVNRFALNSVIGNSQQLRLNASLIFPNDKEADLIRGLFGFLGTHRFSPHAVESYGNHLVQLIHSSEPLYWACVSLWATVRTTRSNKIGRGPRFILSTYVQAIRSLRNSLDRCDGIASDREDLTWSSFILSVVEMRCDTLGDEWTRHHTYGTCRQLSLGSCGSPEDSVSHQTILHSSRIMEACRSILYDSPIAVNDYQWMKAGDVNTTYGSADSLRSIFDELIDYLVQCSHFGSRMRTQIECEISHGMVTMENEALSYTGYRLQQAIITWNFSRHSSGSFTQLAILYQQAMLIYLSGQYDYQGGLSEISLITPRKPQCEIQAHVALIIQLTSHLMNISNLAEVMYLFPLRVAGARAQDPVTRSNVISLTKQIVDRGFAIAERVSSDLQLLWKSQESGLAPSPATVK